MTLNPKTKTSSEKPFHSHSLNIKSISVTGSCFGVTYIFLGVCGGGEHFWLQNNCQNLFYVAVVWSGELFSYSGFTHREAFKYFRKQYIKLLLMLEGRAVWEGKVAIIYNRCHIFLPWPDLICLVFVKITKINMLGSLHFVNGSCVLRLSTGMKGRFLSFSPEICFFVFRWLVMWFTFSGQTVNAKDLTPILGLLVFYHSIKTRKRLI